MNARTECSLVGAIWTNLDGSIEQVNAAASRWLGVEESEVRGRPFHSLLGGGGQFFFQSQILPMLKLKGMLEEIYLRMKVSEGSTIPILANIGFVAINETTKIECSFFRISQRGQLEDELLHAKKMAEQANDAKTKFLGMMSHELRSPLQLLGLNNQMLAEGAIGSMTPEQLEVLKVSQAAADSVIVMVDDILSYARMQGGAVQISTENVPVTAVLQRAETSIRHRIEQAGLNLAVIPSDTRTYVRADQHRLQQILINLLNNAIKFTPRGGSITLKDGVRGNEITISVTDTGCGIPEDQIQRVFEPFVQLRTTIESTDKPGVGLGLSICKDLARAMKGRLEIESSIGTGSTFSVVLPSAIEVTGS